MNTKKLNNNNLSSSNSKSDNWTNKYNFLITNQDNFSKKYYQKILAYDLILKQNYTTVMEIPRIEKIVLNTTSKIFINDKKIILFTLAALELISGQKPQLNYARKSIANFKLRQHQILGCKVVLRQSLMYSFLDKLSKIIFPRIRDYSKKKFITQNNPNNQVTVYKNMFLLPYHKLKKKSTYSLGFQNMMIFPELENNFELVDSFKGMNITFVLSNSNQSPLVLSGFQLPH
jgi:large subunit ribosomal protein L5